jgi:hypothetical protein
MPVIVVGQTGAVWGLNPAAGFIAQLGEADATIEENPSKNADGEVEMTSFYNPTRSVEVGGVFLGGGATLGAAMAVNILIIGQPDGSIFCIGLRTSQSCDGFAGIHLRGKQYSLF